MLLSPHPTNKAPPTRFPKVLGANCLTNCLRLMCPWLRNEVAKKNIDAKTCSKSQITYEPMVKMMAAILPVIIREHLLKNIAKVINAPPPIPLTKVCNPVIESLCSVIAMQGPMQGSPATVAMQAIANVPAKQPM